MVSMFSACNYIGGVGASATTLLRPKKKFLDIFLELGIFFLFNFISKKWHSNIIICQVLSNIPVLSCYWWWDETEMYI